MTLTPDRRLPEASLPAHLPADAVQLSGRYLRSLAKGSPRDLAGSV